MTQCKKATIRNHLCWHPAYIFPMSSCLLEVMCQHDSHAVWLYRQNLGVYHHTCYEWLSTLYLPHFSGRRRRWLSKRSTTVLGGFPSPTSSMNGLLHQFPVPRFILCDHKCYTFRFCESNTSNHSTNWPSLLASYQVAGQLPFVLIIEYLARSHFFLAVSLHFKSWAQRRCCQYHGDNTENPLTI